MKTKNLLFFISVILTFSVYANSMEKVVYGEDNRIDVYQSSSDLFKKLSSSTAAMIPDTAVEIQGDVITIKGRVLEEQGICSDEKFVKQPTAATCSGFLVGKDLLVTSAQCIASMSDCNSNSWVFGYTNTTKETNVFNINKKDVYRCTKIVSRVLDPSRYKLDYAVVKLDRSTDRTPLAYRKFGHIADRASLVAIGHPSGLPTKIAGGAYVRSNDKHYFQAALDTFSGNAGSPVFDEKTGTVEGIVVRGEQDYELDPTANCLRPKVCSMHECHGQDVTRITSVKKL